MRILHIIHRYHPARGGAERYLEKLSSHLSAAGHEVQVVTTDALDFELFWDPGGKRVEEHEGHHQGVAVRRFPVRHLPMSALSFPLIRRVIWLLSGIKPLPLSWLHRLSRFAPWLPSLQEWAETTTQRFDLVGAMTITFDPLFEAAQRLARRQGIPFVAYPLTHLGAGQKPGQDALSRFYTLRHQTALVTSSDALVAQTPAEASYYQDKGMPVERIVISGQGIILAEFAGGDGQRFRTTHGLAQPIILSIGAMSFDKGTQHVVEAVRHLWSIGRRVELVLIGDVLSPFRKFINDIPAADRQRIQLLGPVDEAEKRDALAAATMLAMPSRTESFGTVYLEAWAYSLPVIGATTWGVMDVISDGEDGLLVPFGAVDLLAQAMRQLLDNPQKANEMGRCGREKVIRDYDWQHQCQMVDELYLALTQETRWAR